jgi:hypothetical protein
MRQWPRSPDQSRRPPRRGTDMPTPRRTSATQPVCVTADRVHGRIARIHEAIRGAAGADPEARAVWEKVQTERAIGAQHVIADLEQKSPLRRDLDRQEAIDLLWTLIDPSHYLQLVHHRGWTAERFQAWLTATLQAQLLDPRRRRSGRR